MTERHRHVLPSYADLARDNKRLRRELEDDAALFARLAKSLVGFRAVAGIGARMRVRADRLNELLNAAPAQQGPGVPAPAGKASCPENGRPQALA